MKRGGGVGQSSTLDLAIEVIFVQKLFHQLLQPTNNHRNTLAQLRSFDRSFRIVVTPRNVSYI
jgi:hypothetical protein